MSIQSREYLRRLFSKLIYLHVLQQLLQIHKTCCTSQHVHPEQPSRNDTMQVTRPFTFYSGAVLRQARFPGCTPVMKWEPEHVNLHCYKQYTLSSFSSCNLMFPSSFIIPFHSSPPNTPNKKTCSPIPTNRTNHHHHLCDQRFVTRCHSCKGEVGTSLRSRRLEARCKLLTSATRRRVKPHCWCWCWCWPHLDGKVHRAGPTEANSNMLVSTSKCGTCL